MGSAKRTLAIVALTTTLVGCSSPVLPATTPTTSAEDLRLYATTATRPLVEDLTMAYSEVHPLVKIDARSGNYETMVDQVLGREAPYFLTNHLPAESPLWAAPIGQDGIALIVHPGIEVSGLSISQVRAIYRGRITRWDEVGGADVEIVVFSREDGSGTRAEFDRMVMGATRTTANARVASSSAHMVERVARSPGSIGYVSISYLDDSVRALAVNGIRPTQEHVVENQYPLRSTIFVAGVVEPEGDYRAFIGWVQSPAGQAVVAQRYAPLPGVGESQE